MILDGAAGIGCDSVFLIKNGFSVTSNEIDPNLAMMAMQYSRERAGKVVNLDLQECYWQSLIETMPGGRRFDAVIVLGNSICLVMDEAQRLDVLNQFFGILKQGGTLIIDERNFVYMLENRDEIMKDRFRNFSCSWKVMYCGETVRACPWIIDDNMVIWRVYRNKPPVRNDADIESACIDDLKLYPFKMGELPAMLSKVGFNQIETYSDFLLGIDKTCDFFTHIARKP